MKLSDLPMKANTATAMREGDKITVSISHNIRINRDESWVRFEAQSSIGEHETPDEAGIRVATYVNEQIMKTIEATVDTVNAI